MAAILNKSPLNAQNKERQKSIASVLRYDPALWYFKRVDFQVAKNPQPLCSMIKDLDSIVSGIFQMFHYHGHRERTSHNQVTYAEDSARECHNRIQNLVGHKLFNNLDDIEFLLSHKVDDAACHDIRKRSDELWHETAMLHRQLESENNLDISPESQLCGLLESCKYSLRKLCTSLEEISHEILNIEEIKIIEELVEAAAQNWESEKEVMLQTSDESDEEVSLRIKPLLLRKKSSELVKPALRPSSLASMPESEKGNSMARIRRASEGSRLSKGDSKRTSSSELRCEKCGKGYKHSSCLTKHLSVSLSLPSRILSHFQPRIPSSSHVAQSRVV